ncbi:MAG: hypothetical protein HZB16_24820 [Armatimonadetes bacterium]|nr:hypothetical protein [Armatimonadota bacterium]
MSSARFPWRGLVIGLLAEIPIIFWVVSSEVTARVFISSWSLTMTAVVTLLFLLAANRLIARRHPQHVLSRADLLTVYVMIASTSVIYGYGLGQVLVPTLGGAHWFATPENNYESLLWPLLRDWAVVADKDTLRGLFVGYSTPNWQIWLPRLISFGSFLLAIYATTLGVAMMLSKQWIENEKLTFPIAALPIEMTTDRWEVFRSRTMWVGFAIPLALETLLALHFYFPVVPAIEMKHTQHPEWFATRPWTVCQPLYFGWTPFIVGLAYLAPTEISFSCWFFVALNVVLKVIGVNAGWTNPDGGRAASDFPYLVELTSGGFLAFAACSLWMAKGHLWRSLRGVFRTAGLAPDDLHTSRMALALIVLGALGTASFCGQLGMPLRVCALVFAVYFLVIITLARLRAEGGLAWAFGPDRRPHEFVVWAMGSSSFDRQTLASLGMLHWFFSDVRFAVLPSQMECLKAGHDGGIKPTHLATVICVATVAAVVCGLYAVTVTFHDLGASTAKVYGAANWVSRTSCALPINWLTLRTNPDWFRLAMTALGGVAVTVLHLVRQRVLWWPLHPVGFVMANTGAGVSFVQHYFMAWLIKTIVLRSGGNRLYRQSLPFVIGLILGDITTQTLWSLLATLMGWPVYQFIS